MTKSNGAIVHAWVSSKQVIRTRVVTVAAIAVWLGACDPAIGSPRVEPTWAVDGGEAPFEADGGAPETPFEADGGTAMSEPARTRYPNEWLHSPTTPRIAARLRAIADANPEANDQVFMKVGDSITVSTDSLHCFAGSNVNLAEQAIFEDTWHYFEEGLASDATPFDRVSLAARGGRTAAWVLQGDGSSPLAQEISAIDPRSAIVMFGTNDHGQFESLQATLVWFANNYRVLIERLLRESVIPILSTIPPRTGQPPVGFRVPAINGVIRSLAEAYEVPLMDLYAATDFLPSRGLAGDGVHLNTYRPMGGRPCDFSATGLEYGNNIRNLLTLQALDRLRGALARGEVEPAVDDFRGTGAAADPWTIPELPFAHYASTVNGQTQHGVYESCGAEIDESGPERVYRLDVQQTVRLRMSVISYGEADLDLHVLSDVSNSNSCRARTDGLVHVTLEPGTHFLVVDSFAASTGPRPGEYSLIVHECEAGDPTC